jgi:hypothetical protein
VEGCGHCAAADELEKPNALLAAANARFEDYMRDRHYRTEEAVLSDLRPTDSAKALICAVARWRIENRQERKDG